MSRRRYGTRRERAARLLALVTNGPSFSNPADFGGEPLDKAEASRQYRLWSDSWVLEELVDLVPELQTAAKLEAKGKTPGGGLG